MMTRWRFSAHPPAHKLAAWVGIWLLTRGMMLVQVGFWNDVSGPQLQDVNIFQVWSEQLATAHTMPDGETWQYPPLVAFMLLLPRVTGAPFGESFVGMMLLVDLIGLALLIVLARREQRDTGVWVWLLLMPFLGAFPLLRFDLVPTVAVIAALLVVQTRAVLFGVVVGVGAMLKVWPAIVLLAEWDRRRLGRALLGVAAVVVVVFAAAWIAFGDQSGFFSNQGTRGLQVEAVFATPWQLRQAVTGELVFLVERNGTLEVGAASADTIASLLKWLTLLIGLAVLAWWIVRDRAIRRGATPYLTSLACGRDAVFTVVLLSIVASRVLSPQFLIWMVGLCAVVLGSRETRLRRPAWVVVGAVLLTAGLYQSPMNMVLRNGLLVIAAVDASIVLWRAVRETPAGVGAAR